MSIPEVPGYINLVQVAQGSSSVVYRADDPSHSRQVAIKVMKAPELTEHDRDAFKREVSAMGQLSSHPHIIDLIGSGFLDSRRPFIVMPFYRNGNYGVLVEERGPLEWRQLLDFGVKIASALETAHRRGYVHRDVKPANIYRSDFAGHPVLADFGVSSFVSPSLDGTPTITVAGTPIFSAPEILNGVRPTISSDVYSLGASLFGLAEGRAAYADPSMTAVVAQITSDDPPPAVTAEMPQELRDLIVRMMAKRSEDRHGSALEVVRDLNAIQRDNGLMVTPPLIRIEEEAPAAEPNPPVPTAESPAPTAKSQEGQRIPAQPEQSVSAGLGDQPTMTVHPLDRTTEPIESAVAKKRNATPIESTRPRWLVPILVGLLGFVGIATYGSLSDEDPTGQPLDTQAGLAEAGPIEQRWTDGVELVDIWSAHQGPTVAVEWAADSTRLASGGRDQSLKIWQLESAGQPLAELSVQHWILGMEWSPDGTALAAADSSGGVLVWTVAGSGESALVTIPAHEGPAEAVAWRPDGQLLASGGADGLIRIWQPDGSEVQTIEGHDDSIMALDWAANASLPTSGAKDAMARSWTVNQSGGHLADQSFEGHTDWVRSVDWGPNAELLATSSSDNTVRVWTGASGQQVGQLDLDSDPLGSVAWSPDGRMLAIGGEDGSVKLWNGTQQSELVAASGSADAVTGLSWSPEGDTVAVGRLDGTIAIWRGGPAE